MYNTIKKGIYVGIILGALALTGCSDPKAPDSNYLRLDRSPVINNEKDEKIQDFKKEKKSELEEKTEAIANNQ